MDADDSRMDADVELVLGDVARAKLAGREDFPLKPLTEKIIGAAFEVHNHLGSGFLEKIYENALVRELVDRGLRIETQRPIPVSYKGALVGSYFADVLVESSVICEIKALDGLLPIHEYQILNYLKATGIPVGLLLNFGTARVQVKRMVRTK
jgi:GxxExxY protein